MSAIFWMAWRSLRQGGRRTLTLGLAVACSAALLVSLAALARGMETTLERTATTVLCGQVEVTGYHKRSAERVLPLIQAKFAADLRLAVRRLAPEAVLSQRARGYGRVVGPRSALSAVLTGVELDAEPQLAAGLIARAGQVEGLNAPNTAVLFERQAKRLGVEVGDRLLLSAQTPEGAVNTVDVRVVAIVADAGPLSAWTVFVPTATVLTLYDLPLGSTAVLQLRLPPERAAEVAARLRAELAVPGLTVLPYQDVATARRVFDEARTAWTGQGVAVTTWKEETSFVRWILNGFATLRLACLMLLAAVVGLGVTNAAYASVTERTKELGTLRALGLSRAKLLGQVLLESGLLGFFASLAGALLGVAAVLALDAARISLDLEALRLVLMSDRLAFSVGAGEVASAVGGLTLLSALAALPPAWRAARLKPAVALGAK